MNSVIVYDEYSQPWKVLEDDILYSEALAAQEKSKNQRIIWPLKKITEYRGWGWWTVFKDIDEIEIDLEKLMVHPGKERLIEIGKEYNPTELRDMLQTFGSNVSTLHVIEGKISGHCHGLREGFKTGMAIAIARLDSKAATITAKENEILDKQELFRDTKKLQIKNEACLELVQGWRKAYENAWSTVSRIISLEIGEASLQTGRHP